MLDLLDALVREGDNAGLAVGALAKEIAHTASGEGGGLRGGLGGCKRGGGIARKADSDASRLDK